MRNGQHNTTFKVIDDLGNPITCTTDDLKTDAPSLLANFVLSKPAIRTQHPKLFKWASDTKAKADKAVITVRAHNRRFGISTLTSDVPEITCRRTEPIKIERMSTKVKRPSKNQRPLDPSGEHLYGIRIPQNTEEAIKIDHISGTLFGKMQLLKN
jgi:hypothetical protein